MRGYRDAGQPAFWAFEPWFWPLSEPMQEKTQASGEIFRDWDGPESRYCGDFDAEVRFYGTSARGSGGPRIGRSRLTESAVPANGEIFREDLSRLQA